MNIDSAHCPMYYGNPLRDFHYPRPLGCISVLKAPQPMPLAVPIAPCCVALYWIIPTACCPM